MYQTIVDCVAHAGTTQVHKAVLLFALALLGVGLGVGFSITTTNARNASADDFSRRQALFSAFQMNLTTRITGAGALAQSLGGFAMADPYLNSSSYAIPVTNFSTPPASRMRTFDDYGFHQLADRLYIQGITTLALAPGGIVTQFMPPGSTVLGFNLQAAAVYTSTFEAMLTTRQMVTSGPNKFAARDGYGVIVWYPLFMQNIVGPDTFYGAAFASMEMTELLTSMNVTNLKKVHKVDYALWYTAPEVAQPTVMVQSNPAATARVMAEGMRFELPISQPGRHSYFAMHPQDGPVSATMSTNDAVAVVVAVVLATVALVGCFYLCVLAYFMYRHRRAPAVASRGRSSADAPRLYMAALSLRGAQPIAERAPLEAVQIFADFTACMRRMATAFGCYPVCEVGDRTVYVVSRDAGALVSLAKSAVLDGDVHWSAQPVVVHKNHKQNNNNTSVVGRVQTVDDESSESAATNLTRSVSRALSRRNGATTNRTDPTAASECSSFIGSCLCRPSVALHVVPSTHSAFDAARDVYFYGSPAQLGKLYAALDGTRGGEVGWTHAFEEACGTAYCRELEHAAVGCHIVSESTGNNAKNSESGQDGDNGASLIVLHVASLCKDTGDERDNEDPSVAMAALSDVYLRRMTAIVSDGRAAGREDRGSGAGAGRHNKGGEKGGNGGSSGGSDKSADATAVTRNATLLHIAILGGGCGGGDGQPRMPLDVVRRIVAEEKGAVISAHDTVIVAAFNLLSPGGHHQVRAADTVMRLRAAIPPSVPFVCSIHQGKVSALIADGLVMCSGPVSGVGRRLLDHAATMAADAERYLEARKAPHIDAVTAIIDDHALQAGGRPLPAEPAFDFVSNRKGHASADGEDDEHGEDVIRGLCLLFAQSDLSSSYECEAVDVVPAGLLNQSRQKNSSSNATSVLSQIVYRLAHRKATAAAGKRGGVGRSDEDEWMYQLRDDEDRNPYAAVNAVFSRIANGRTDEAAQCWENNVLGTRKSVGEAEVTGVMAEKASVYARLAAGRLLPSSAQ